MNTHIAHNRGNVKPLIDEMTRKQHGVMVGNRWFYPPTSKAGDDFDPRRVIHGWKLWQNIVDMLKEAGYTRRQLVSETRVFNASGSEHQLSDESVDALIDWTIKQTNLKPLEQVEVSAPDPTYLPPQDHPQTEGEYLEDPEEAGLKEYQEPDSVRLENSDIDEDQARWEMAWDGIDNTLTQPGTATEASQDVQPEASSPPQNEVHQEAGSEVGTVECTETLPDKRPETLERTTWEPESFAALSGKEIEPLRVIVEPFATEGTTLLCGDPKVGKSWMVLDMLDAVTMGKKFLGRFDGMPGRALYVSLEDNERTFRSRMDMHYGSAPRPSKADVIFWANKFGGKKNTGISDLEGYVARHKADLRLVVIDTLQMVRGDGDKTAFTIYGKDYKLITLFKELAYGFGISIVLIHHLTKSEDWATLKAIAGSTGLAGSADSLVLLHRPMGATQGTICYTSRHVPEGKMKTSFNKETCRWSWEGEETGDDLKGNRKAILTVMTDQGAPMSARDVFAALDGTIRLNTVQKLFSRMASDGTLKPVRGKRGLYEIP